MSSSSSNSSRTRKQRLLRFGVDKSATIWGVLFDGERNWLLFKYVLFVGLIAIINQSWQPAFFYQIYYTPSHSICSRVDFSAYDEESIEMARLQAKQQAIKVYRHDDAPIMAMYKKLHHDLQTIHSAEDYSKISHDLLSHFVPVTSAQTSKTDKINKTDKNVKTDKNSKNVKTGTSDNQFQNCFDSLRTLFDEDEDLNQFDNKLNRILQPYWDRGVLRDKGNIFQQKDDIGDEIKIVPNNNLNEEPKTVKTDVVRIQDWNSIKQEIKKEFGSNDKSDMIFHWLKQYLPSTLVLDPDLTNQEGELAAKKVQIIKNNFRKNNQLAEAGKLINSNTWNILKAEYKTWESQQSIWDQVLRFTVTWAALCLFFIPSIYFSYKKSPKVFDDKNKSILLCIITLLVVWAAKQLSALGCNGQAMPLFIYAMLIGIAFGRRSAFLLSSCMIIIAVLGSGGGLMDLLYLNGVIGISILPLNNIYDRKKLMYISFGTAVTAFFLSMICNILNQQPMNLELLKYAGLSALWIVGGGFLIQGLVPFEEWFFGITTDTQLLELSNPTHPLMQELIQRAPSTYNHSTFVAAISEAAARSIGAWGLLCRVGALYHDIGKFVTPEYFVENQKSLSDSQHTNLTPSMSALVIINHVNNGVVLAKKWNLPPQVIDMIEQHHGTTLVKYFYNKAIEEQKKKMEESESDPEMSSTGLARLMSEEVDESMFRYPGPKPQTKETAILMLADCVESACRTLVEPTPKRVEDLVRSITADKLQDGQFDETQLTFNELKTIQDAIVLAIMSIYHARIKYPSQE